MPPFVTAEASPPGRCSRTVRPTEKENSLWSDRDVLLVVEPTWFDFRDDQCGQQWALEPGGVQGRRPSGLPRAAGRSRLLASSLQEQGGCSASCHDRADPRRRAVLPLLVFPSLPPWLRGTGTYWAPGARLLGTQPAAAGPPWQVSSVTARLVPGEERGRGQVAAGAGECAGGVRILPGRTR